MSVIFNALQKLKAQSVNETKSEEAFSQKKQGSSSFQKMLFSPFTILVFVLIGVVAFYGIDYLKVYIEKNRKLYVTDKIDLQNTEVFEDSQPPESAPVQPMKPDRSDLSVDQYNTPESRNHRNAHNELQFLPQRKLVTENDPPPLQGDSNYFKPSGQINQAPDTNLKSNETGLPSEITSVSDLSKRALLEKAPENQVPQLSKEERNQQAKIKKRSKIARIVTKIEDSILQKNYDQTEILINKLTPLKDKNNNYVLKLKAFLLVKKENYESAAPLLEKVLNKNKHDLEAGINMAIIEAKTNQKQAAKIRLAKLAKIYPENTLVPEILKKLE